MADIAPIANFIRREFLFDRETTIGNDDAVFPDLIDSLRLMEVVDFIESSYKIVIDDDDLLVGNFATLNAMGELIDRKSA